MNSSDFLWRCVLTNTQDPHVLEMALDNLSDVRPSDVRNLPPRVSPSPAWCYARLGSPTLLPFIARYATDTSVLDTIIDDPDNLLNVDLIIAVEKNPHLTPAQARRFAGKQILGLDNDLKNPHPWSLEYRISRVVKLRELVLGPTSEAMLAELFTGLTTKQAAEVALSLARQEYTTLVLRYVHLYYLRVPSSPLDYLLDALPLHPAELLEELPQPARVYILTRLLYILGLPTRLPRRPYDEKLMELFIRDTTRQDVHVNLSVATPPLPMLTSSAVERAIKYGWHEACLGSQLTSSQRERITKIVEADEVLLQALSASRAYYHRLTNPASAIYAFFNPPHIGSNSDASVAYDRTSNDGAPRVVVRTVVEALEKDGRTRLTESDLAQLLGYLTSPDDPLVTRLFALTPTAVVTRYIRGNFKVGADRPTLPTPSELRRLASTHHVPFALGPLPDTTPDEYLCAVAQVVPGGALNMTNPRPSAYLYSRLANTKNLSTTITLLGPHLAVGPLDELLATVNLLLISKNSPDLAQDAVTTH